MQCAIARQRAGSRALSCRRRSKQSAEGRGALQDAICVSYMRFCAGYINAAGLACRLSGKQLCQSPPVYRQLSGQHAAPMMLARWLCTRRLSTKFFGSVCTMTSLSSYTFLQLACETLAHDGAKRHGAHFLTVGLQFASNGATPRTPMRAIAHIAVSVFTCFICKVCDPPPTALGSTRAPHWLTTPLAACSET